MADRLIQIVVGMDRGGNTFHSYGFLDQRIGSEISYDTMTHYASGLQPRGTARYQLWRPIDSYTLGPLTAHSDGFFIASRPSLFDTMQTYRALHDEKMGRQVRPSPDEAWEPLWVPWGGAEGNWDWSLEENLQSVAKMLSTLVISGVPQLGVDLVNMAQEHRALVKTWLSFYHEHKEEFR